MTTKIDMPDNRRFVQTKTHPLKRQVAKGPLRFGIDVDGTISQAPQHFKRLIDALLNRGNEVYVVTGRTEDMRQKTDELLECLEIRYTELLMRPRDWPGTVADFKVWMVREKEIHLVIDDNAENCWAIERQTEALAAHMLPIPEMPEASAVKARLRRQAGAKDKKGTRR